MSLIPCPECKKKISHTVQACPHCGYSISGSEGQRLKKQTDQSQVIATIIVLGGSVLMVMFCCSGIFTSRPSEPKSAVESRQDQIESQFSAWDGSHRNLVKFVKDSLRDPNSFEHQETSYVDEDSYLLLNMKYRAKNGFGGMNSGSISARAGLNGEIIEVIAHQN